MCEYDILLWFGDQSLIMLGFLNIWVLSNVQGTELSILNNVTTCSLLCTMVQCLEYSPPYFSFEA